MSSRANLWWPLCVSGEPVQSCGLVMFFSCIVFVWLWWQEYTFLDADTWIVWGPKFDELCACLSQCAFILCVKCMISVCCLWCIWLLFCSDSVIFSWFIYDDIWSQNNVRIVSLATLSPLFLFLFIAYLYSCWSANFCLLPDVCVLQTSCALPRILCYC